MEEKMATTHEKSTKSTHGKEFIVVALAI